MIFLFSRIIKIFLDKEESFAKVFQIFIFGAKKNYFLKCCQMIILEIIFMIFQFIFWQFLRHKMGKSIACILFPKLHYRIVFGLIGSNNCGEEGKDESRRRIGNQGSRHSHHSTVAWTVVVKMSQLPTAASNTHIFSSHQQQ